MVNPVVITPPKPVVDTVQYYDETGTLQTGTDINLPSKNGIRLVITLSPSYGSRTNQWQTIEFEYSTDSGATWNSIPTGSITASTADTQDTGEPSQIETTYGTTLTLDFYAVIQAFAQDVQVRSKITDLAKFVWEDVLVTYNVTRMDVTAFTLQSEETFNREVSKIVDWSYLTLQNEETFDRLINKS